MPQTAQQIVAKACQIAKGPGYTSQAGDMLNSILQELAQDYNFDLAKQTYVFNFNPSLITSAVYPNITPGGGPYPLPANYLRMVDEKQAMWYLLGVPYPMIPCDLSEYDGLVQQAGLTSYPYIFATDMSQSPPNLVVYPPPSGSFQCLIRYYAQMPDISNPASSTTVPWFPNQTYLVRRLAGEMMAFTGDQRFAEFLSDREDSGGAGDILRKYLKLKDDNQDRALTVRQDRRRFGRNWQSLPNTKTVGW